MEGAAGKARGSPGIPVGHALDLDGSGRGWLVVAAFAHRLRAEQPVEPVNRGEAEIAGMPVGAQVLHRAETLPGEQQHHDRRRRAQRPSGPGGQGAQHGEDGQHGAKLHGQRAQRGVDQGQAQLAHGAVR